MTDDELFVPLTAAIPAAPKPRRCLHPRGYRLHADPTTGLPLAEGTSLCGRCSTLIDARDARRGRNNRARGNSIEREIGRRLGLRRVGQYGGPDDLAGEIFVAQVKSGGAFPERLWAWLKAVPVNAGQTALLVVTDAPGPGYQRRALVVLDIKDWEQLHRAEARRE